MTDPLLPSELREAWKVVASATVGYGAGASVFLTTASLFVRPMQEEFGWSTTEVTILPIVYIMMSLCIPIAGMLVDRWGARRIAIAGLSLLALAVSGLAFVPASKLLLYLLVAVVGLVAPLSNAPPFMKGVASWFKRSAGTALGLMGSGSSVIALVALPTISATIHYFGWRAGYLAIAGIVALLALPTVLLWFRERPLVDTCDDAAGHQGGVSIRDAFRQRSYWILGTSVIFAAVPMGGFLASLIPILEERDFSITAATSLAMVYSAGLIVGRIGAGMLLDRFHAGRVAAVLLFTAGSGTLLLALATPDMSFLVTVLAVALAGSGHGAESDFIAYFTLKLFGLYAYATIAGSMAMVAALTIAAAGSGFALCKDLTGSYLIAVEIGAACYAISGLLFLVMFRRRLTLVQARASRSDQTT